MIEAAGDIGVPVVCRATTLYDIYTADECFLTGTAAEMIPVVKVDGRPIGDGRPGPLTADLKKAFLDRIKMSLA